MIAAILGRYCAGAPAPSGPPRWCDTGRRMPAQSADAWLPRPTAAAGSNTWCRSTEVTSRLASPAPHWPQRPGHAAPPGRPGQLHQRLAQVPILPTRPSPALLPQRPRPRRRLGRPLTGRRFRGVLRVLPQPGLKLSDPLPCRGQFPRVSSSAASASASSPRSDTTTAASTSYGGGP
jgi:hypothetical protein